MKFLNILEESDDSDWVKLLFEEHDAGLLCIGDQVWSDGEVVDLYCCLENEVLDEVLGEVSNKKAFLGALRLLGIYQ